MLDAKAILAVGLMATTLLTSLSSGCSRCTSEAPVEGQISRVRLSLGGLHGCLVEPAGTVRCWGSNRHGQLGLGVEGGESPLPEKVPGLVGVVALAAGLSHTCAVNRQRRVTCWGSNLSGQLGDGTFDQRNAPEFSRADDVVELRAGGDHTCVRTRDDQVLCWGCNLAGQLGNGNSARVVLDDGGELDLETTREINETEPVRAVGLQETIELAIGSSSTCNNHTCALDRHGRVRCWGESRFGALGDGSPPPPSLPYSRATAEKAIVLDPAKSLTAGGGHTCAVLQSSKLSCWGRNDHGQIGDGTTEPRRAPVAVEGLDSVLAAAAGHSHTCAVLEGGRVVCWGNNESGQLGTGDTTDRHTPTPIEGLPDVELVAAGDLSSCALTNEGEVHCWGRGHQITPTKLF